MRRILSSLVSVSCLVFALCGSVGDAQACSAPQAGVYERAIFPANGEAGLPRNVEIAVEYRFTAGFGGGDPLQNEKLMLKDAQGQEIDATAESFKNVDFSGRTLFVLKPKQPLAANATYEIYSLLQKIPCYTEMSATKCEIGAAVKIATFTTGADEDTQAPASVGDAALKCGQRTSCDAGACCGPYSRTSFSLSWKAPAGEAFPAGLRYNIYSSDDLSKPILARVSQTSLAGYFYHSGSFHFPSGLELKGVTGRSFVIRAIDAAGNEEQNTTTVGFPGGSCTTPRESVEGEGPTSPPDHDGGSSPDDGGGTRDDFWNDHHGPRPDKAPDATPDGGFLDDIAKDDAVKDDKGFGCQIASGASGPAGSMSFLWLLGLLCLPLAFSTRKRR